MIDIDTTKMRNCGNDIIKLSSDLNEIIESFYKRIADMPEKTGEWQGKSADVYAKNAIVEKEQMVQFKNTLYGYGRILVDNANKYEKTINDNLM